ncbi:SIP domain-containing protein [Microbacterium sp. 18062]|uniref:SIP domain-containing protein n=1 Tax=Microbacterium sp. 18062 TaxID=2681410 RepID=UPI001356AE43|nr:SIP domain-containing protein [Microbacterium sp. 18062]
MELASPSRSEPDWESIEGAVLLAGDAHDVPTMVAIARRLSPEVTASILIESFTTIQRHRVRVPENVAVTWLIRERRGCDSSPCAVRGRGERLAVGIYAWCAEWVVDDETTPCTVWLGPRTSPHIVRMAQAQLRAA